MQVPFTQVTAGELSSEGPYGSLSKMISKEHLHKQDLGIGD